MKKLLFALALVSTPALACPNHDEAPATKTADQKTKPATTAKQTPAPAPATTGKPADKPADKVSSR